MYFQRAQLHKSLGQHFLTDNKVAQKIAHTFMQATPPSILEIGAGAGALTQFILPALNHHQYKAVEIDAEKYAFLRTAYPQAQHCFLLADILQLPCPFEELFGVVSNLPYNIASQILLRMLEWQARIPLMVLMFQKEMADRIIAPPHTKAYGILSVLAQAYYQVHSLMECAPQCFFPPPRVYSKVLVFVRRTDISVSNHTAFKTLVRKAFAMRRKQLKNNIGALFPDLREEALMRARAEDMAVDVYVRLSNQIK